MDARDLVSFPPCHCTTHALTSTTPPTTFSALCVSTSLLCADITLLSLICPPYDNLNQDATTSHLLLHCISNQKINTQSQFIPKMHYKEVWNPNRIIQPMQRMPLLRNQPPSILAPLHASCPPSNFHSQTLLVHKWSNCIWLHFAYLSSWVINPFGEWQASVRYFGVSMRSSVSDRASVSATVSPKLLQQQCAPAFTHTRSYTHTLSRRGTGGSARTERGGRATPAGASIAQPTGRARAHTHTTTYCSFIVQGKSLVGMHICINCM